MKRLIATLIFLTATGTATAADDLKPTIFTSPPDYLQTFPLGSVTEEQMVEHAGPPDNVVDVAGKRRLVYKMGRGYGARTYSYLLTDGIVTEVIYNDSGQYNGMRASTAQKK